MDSLNTEFDRGNLVFSFKSGKNGGLNLATKANGCKRRFRFGTNIYGHAGRYCVAGAMKNSRRVQKDAFLFFYF